MNECKTCHVQHMDDQYEPTKIQVINKMENNPYKIQDMNDMVIRKNYNGKKPQEDTGNRNKTVNKNIFCNFIGHFFSSNGSGWD